MSGSRGKQLTPEQIATGARDLSIRLRRHLDNLDAGDPTAAQDVAGVVRTLATYGKGDNAIIRLCRAHQLDLPTVMLTRVDAIPQREGARLWIGGLPINGRLGIDFAGTTTTLNIEEWMVSDALISRGAKPLSWQKLIAQLANTWGSHLSTETPDLITEIDLADVAEISLGHYVIRQAGWVAEDFLRQVLPQVGHSIDHLPSRVLAYNNLIIASILVRDRPPYLDFKALASTLDPSDQRSILRLRMDGYEISAGLSSFGMSGRI